MRHLQQLAEGLYAGLNALYFLHTALLRESLPESQC